MKRRLNYIAFVIILSSVLIGCSNSMSGSGNINRPQSDDYDSARQTLTGYFYFGYIDIREKFEGPEEEEYFYYMDNYFRTYHEESFLVVRHQEETKASDADYTNYFQEMGLDLLSMSNKENHLQNGDYISVEIEGPIMESYPAQAKVKKVERIAARTQN